MIYNIFKEGVSINLKPENNDYIQSFLMTPLLNQKQFTVYVELNCVKNKKGKKNNLSGGTCSLLLFGDQIKSHNHSIIDKQFGTGEYSCYHTYELNQETFQNVLTHFLNNIQCDGFVYFYPPNDDDRLQTLIDQELGMLPPGRAPKLNCKAKDAMDCFTFSHLRALSSKPEENKKETFEFNTNEPTTVNRKGWLIGGGVALIIIFMLLILLI